MAIKFTTTKESAKANGVKVLVYGKAGVGKTVLCSTAPKPLIISAEAGLLSLRNHDIPVIEITSLQDLIEAYNFVITDKKAAEFQTICLDSISEMGEIVLAAAKADTKDPRQAYGVLIDEMLKQIKAFRDLKGKNVYFSAKETKIVDSVSNTVSFEPGLPGSKLGADLPYYFDEVFQLGTKPNDKGEPERVLRTASDFQVVAKDRSGALATFEPPNLKHVFDKIIGA